MICSVIGLRVLYPAQPKVSGRRQNSYPVFDASKAKNAVLSWDPNSRSRKLIRKGIDMNFQHIKTSSLDQDEPSRITVLCTLLPSPCALSPSAGSLLLAITSASSSTARAACCARSVSSLPFLLVSVAL